VKPSIDRHPSIGFYNYALSYHVAADLICDQGLKATHPEAPAMFLYYHAIELYLKSFLRFHGVSAKRLQSIGHDYKRLLSRASKHGLVLGELENEVLSMLDGIFGADRATWRSGSFDVLASVRSLQRVALYGRRLPKCCVRQASRFVCRAIRRQAVHSLKAEARTV